METLGSGHFISMGGGRILLMKQSFFPTFFLSEITNYACFYASLVRNKLIFTKYRNQTFSPMLLLSPTHLLPINIKWPLPDHKNNRGHYIQAHQPHFGIRGRQEVYIPVYFMFYSPNFNVNCSTSVWMTTKNTPI